MLIGNKQHTVGNKTRYEIEYHEWLDDGRTISGTGFSAVISTLPALNDIVVGQVSVTASRLYFYVSGGSVNETFTVEVQITDTLGEIVIDTINFTVVQP